jgi:hypothetical protein
LDAAAKILDESALNQRLVCGTRGELIFYDRCRKQYSLEPLLDAGAKADFTGLRPSDHVMTNFDVTTNISY